MGGWVTALENLGLIQPDTIKALRQLRFGYIPYQDKATSPGDRRRFPLVAQKLGLNLEIDSKDSTYDVIYVTNNADLTRYRRYPSG